jgi:translation initiation factor RLI1
VNVDPPHSYGVVTAPFSVREGINVFLAGFIPTENLRFRDVELSFKIAESAEGECSIDHFARYELRGVDGVVFEKKLGSEGLF